MLTQSLRLLLLHLFFIKPLWSTDSQFWILRCDENKMQPLNARFILTSSPHRLLHPWLQLQPLPRAQASKAPVSKPSPPCVSSSQSAQLHNLQPFSLQRNEAKERGAVLQEGQCLCDTVLISGRQCSYFLYNLACFCHNLECQGMAPFAARRKSKGLSFLACPCPFSMNVAYC